MLKAIYDELFEVKAVYYASVDQDEKSKERGALQCLRQCTATKTILLTTADD